MWAYAFLVLLGYYGKAKNNILQGTLNYGPTEWHLYTVSLYRNGAHHEKFDFGSVRLV